MIHLVKPLPTPLYTKTICSEHTFSDTEGSVSKTEEDGLDYISGFALGMYSILFALMRMRRGGGAAAPSMRLFCG